jgi:serine/threonine protein phosphatase PrpC
VNWDDIIEDAAATDTGMRRSNNQDSHAIVRAPRHEAWKIRGHIFMVADGMGAHAVGELASKLACDNIPHNYNKMKGIEPGEAITKAYKEVGSLIHTRASANKDFKGMGTTCSTLLLLPEGALIAHIGDSRVYRIRHERIDQLSFDHSLAWELVRRNHLSPEEAMKVVPRNVITRSLGPDPNIEVDIEGPHPVEPGDVFLLCSDGLSGHIEDPELGVFAANFHPKDACRYLVALANLRGGQDNITVVMARIGPWVEPESAQDIPKQDTSKDGNGRKGGGLGKLLAGLFSGRKKPDAEPVEENIYRTAPCAITAEFIDTLAEQMRRAQGSAIERTWPVDWTMLTAYRRQAEDALAAGKPRSAVRALGEAIALLATAGRLHKKTGGAASVS